MDLRLMKGNEAIAEAAIRGGCDGYFGYPITPQSEVMETLTDLRPGLTTGMVVLQAESEVASINMLYGGASTGARAMTSSSSPGISLMSEGLSYLAGAELPCLVEDVSRGARDWAPFSPRRQTTFRLQKGEGMATTTSLCWRQIRCRKCTTLCCSASTLPLSTSTP